MTTDNPAVETELSTQEKVIASLVELAQERNKAVEELQNRLEEALAYIPSAFTVDVELLLDNIDVIDGEWTEYVRVSVQPLRTIYDEDGESRREFYVVQPSYEESSKYDPTIPRHHQLFKNALAGSFRYGCSCEHDCCGHWFSNVIDVIHNNMDDTYMVVVRSGINI